MVPQEINFLATKHGDLLLDRWGGQCTNRSQSSPAVFQVPQSRAAVRAHFGRRLGP